MRVVVAPLPDKTAREIGAKVTKAKKRKLKQAGGDHQWVVDFKSDTIDTDFTYVFGLNVARARRENKRVIGTADGIVAAE